MILSEVEVNILKINEVEALVGITKKNIRFYESEGLLNPQRNSENGYRNYGDADVEILRRIKLMRKLGVPIEEIRRMRTGQLTVADAMHRHQVVLDREEANLRQAQKLCSRLEQDSPTLNTLDASGLLSEMEQLEQEGTTFMNKQKNDTKRRRYAATIAMAVVMSIFMAGIIWLMLWSFRTDPAGAPPMPLLVLLLLIPALVILGVVIALLQRIREIGKGEEDDARKY